MIGVITLNPAIDKMCDLKSLKVGEVNRIDNVTLIAGGKGINVARTLRILGEDVIVSGFIGDGNKEIFKKEFKDYSMEDCFVLVEGNTRVNTNIMSDEGVTEVLEPGFVINEDNIRLFMAEYGKITDRAEIIIISGSLPKGVDVSILSDMINMANEKGIKVILDTSGEGLKKGLEAHPYAIKPNKRELEYLLGAELGAGARADVCGVIKEKAQEIMSKYSLKEMIVSLGEDGFIYLNESESYKVTGPVVDALSTVGCGDCLVGAYSFGLAGGAGNGGAGNGDGGDGMALEDRLKLMYSASAASAKNIKGGVWEETDKNNIAENVVITTI